MEKSYVAMDICLYCGETKQILMDKRMKNSLENGVHDQEPCDACKEKMSKGFTFLECDEKTNVNTGTFWVIKEEATRRIMNEEFIDSLKAPVCRITKEMATDLGLYEELDSDE